MPVHLDLSRFPIVIASLQGTVTDEELTKHLADVVARVLSRREAFVMINDATGLVGVPSAKTRRIIGEWTLRNDEDLVRYGRGAVLVTESPILRGMLTAIQWIAPSRVERIARGTLLEAENWARERLRDRIPRRDSRAPRP